MWLIEKISDGTIHYLLSNKKCYTVGRKNTDLVLSDPSVSRLHCELNVGPRGKDGLSSSNSPITVSVIDKNSKYGTYIQRNNEWMKIDGENAHSMSNGTVIRFGLMDNIWRLEYKPFIACSSRLTNDQTQELKMLMSQVDGKLISKCTKQCTIVFVNDITLTVKNLLALINGIPIVTTNWLHKLIENIKENLSWPSHTDFRPEISESTLECHLVSLNPEDHRKELFKGKKFLIPTDEQLKYLSEIIVAAGGSAHLLEFDGNCQKLAADNTIVIQYSWSKILKPDPKVNYFKNAESVLKNEYGIRAVPETEIFQAIAYSSTEKYCNPSVEAFKLRPNSVGRGRSPTTTTLEMETRSSDNETGIHGLGIVPETGSERIDMTPISSLAVREENSSTTKRKRNNSRDTNYSKRFASSSKQGEIQGMIVPETDDQGEERTDLIAVEMIEKYNEYDKSSEAVTSTSRKRKLSPSILDDDEETKRKAVDVSNVSLVEKVIADVNMSPIGKVGAVGSVEAIGSVNVLEHLNSLSFGEEVSSITDWIQKKNSRGRGVDYRFDFDRSELESKNVKVFRKKEKYQNQCESDAEGEKSEDGEIIESISGWIKFRSLNLGESCQS